MTYANALICTIFILIGTPTFADKEHDHHHESPIEAPEGLQSEAISGGVHVIYGEGGNIGIFAGEKGTFLIDNKFTHTVTQVQRAIAALSSKPVKFIINTHHHYDHAGGNTAFGKDGSVILAHENVRKRLSSDYVVKAFDKAVPATPAEGLPVITFTKDMTLHLEGHTIIVQHFPHAHTDGDAVIFFEEENIIHTGDIFFNGFYPFIDVGGGGSLRGVIAAQSAILNDIDDNTAIIPGHGPLATKADLTAARDMLSAFHVNVATLVSQGKSREEAIKAKPGAAFDAAYGGGFLAPDVFAGIVYDSIVAEIADNVSDKQRQD